MEYKEVQKIAKDTIEYAKKNIYAGMSLIEIREMCERKMLELGADSFGYWDIGAFVSAGYGTEKYFNSILTDADGNSISMIRDSNNTISGDDKYDSLSDLPDFVTENKAVTDQLVTWQTVWMSKYSIDYYRVDTVF